MGFAKPYSHEWNLGSIRMKWSFMGELLRAWKLPCDFQVISRVGTSSPVFNVSRF